MEGIISPEKWFEFKEMIRIDSSSAIECVVPFNCKQRLQSPKKKKKKKKPTKKVRTKTENQWKTCSITQKSILAYLILRQQKFAQHFHSADCVVMQTPRRADYYAKQALLGSLIDSESLGACRITRCGSRPNSEGSSSGLGHLGGLAESNFGSNLNALVVD